VWDCCTESTTVTTPELGAVETQGPTGLVGTFAVDFGAADLEWSQAEVETLQARRECASSTRGFCPNAPPLAFTRPGGAGGRACRTHPKYVRLWGAEQARVLLRFVECLSVTLFDSSRFRPPSTSGCRQPALTAGGLADAIRDLTPNSLGTTLCVFPLTGGATPRSRNAANNCAWNRFSSGTYQVCLTKKGCPRPGRRVAQTQNTPPRPCALSRGRQGRAHFFGPRGGAPPSTP